MQTKTYLSQLWNIDRRIKDKLEEAERWRKIAYDRSIGGGSGNTSERVQSTPNPDKIGDAIAKSVDYYNEAKQISKEMVEKKHTIELQIDSIEDDTHYNVLHSYYIDEKSLNEIALDEHYSYKSAKRKFESAIKHFESIYGKEYL